MTCLPEYGPAGSGSVRWRRNLKVANVFDLDILNYASGAQRQHAQHKHVEAKHLHGRLRPGMAAKDSVRAILNLD